MEQTAPPGGLRISHETYAHVRGVFDVEPQPPLSVKGVDAPLRTYLVLRARPRAFRVATRGIEGVETRMIGRDAELQALQAAFECVMAPGAGLQRVLVVADAGVGKSRLLYEFDNWADARPDRFFIFQARATPQSVTQPYSAAARSVCLALPDPRRATACRRPSASSKTHWCPCSPAIRANTRPRPMRTCWAS